ncbi:MAG: hypothetical protein JWQ35_1985 [Bacteriovoracaceae bacterium]|nr:hypothetical protein [Bacteriovoracaceae bacterium]
MTNVREALLKHLEEIAFFLEYKGENPFKIRAFNKAAEVLETLDEAELNKRIQDKSLLELKGIGKGTFSIAESFFKNQISDDWKEAKGTLPLSLLELRVIRGLGPAKIRALFEELQICTLGELEYACNENRLVELKSFGEKSQKKILDALQEIKTHQGKLLLSDALVQAEAFEKTLPKHFKFFRVGDLGRQLETVDGLDYLIPENAKKPPISHFPVRFHLSRENNLAIKRIELTSSKEHWKSLEKAAEKNKIKFSTESTFETEEEIYKKLGLLWCEPYERELPAVSKRAGELCELKDLTGVFHLHTVASDGTNTLEEMADAARKHHWKFMGLSDHSQSAFYAQGLKEDALDSQWEEIEALNKKYPDFKILRGVESDILKDGRLDYPDSTLKKFDFVIASIHSRYGMMDMTDRILKAIENPYTTMIGHLTGRLLLAREGYQLDFQKIISAAIKNKKIIELNSHPHRLDIDWRYLSKACQAGLLISINPDAHSVAGFDNVKFGVWMSRKAGVPKENIFNTWSFEKISEYLKI